MVYNAFAAFELRLSLLVESFWQNIQGLGEREFKDLFGRTSVFQRMDQHLPLICRKFQIPSRVYEEKKKLLNALREQRNFVVHSGRLDAGKETDKNKLYSIACWAILFLEMLENKILTSV